MMMLYALFCIAVGWLIWYCLGYFSFLYAIKAYNAIPEEKRNDDWHMDYRFFMGTRYFLMLFAGPLIFFVTLCVLPYAHIREKEPKKSHLERYIDRMEGKC